MNTALIDAVNTQIALELDSALLYLAFSVTLKSHGLPGMAHWMRRQYTEENQHAMQLINHLEHRLAPVTIPALTRPLFEWEKPIDIFRLALAHERRVTLSINELVSLCQHEKDYATQYFLFDYVKEQVEEEHQIVSIIDKILLCGPATSDLLSLDNELSTRT